MAQHYLTNGKKQKSWIRIWGIVLATGITGGVLTGLLLGLVGWLFIILVYMTRDGQQESNQFLLMMLTYIAMTALSGRFVAQKTEQGTESGAFCGLLAGPIAILLMTLSIAAPHFLPSLRIYVDPNASLGAYAASWDRSFWFLFAFIALPTSLVSGPVLGAFGARMWDQTHCYLAV